MTIESAMAQNVIYPVLETFFKAEIRHVYAGQVATDAAGIVLPQVEFKSTWITPNKLLKDFYESVAKHLYSVIDPDKGCVIWIRDGGTVRQGDRNFTHFHYAVDALGYDANVTPEAVKLSADFSACVAQQTFSAKDIFVGICESRGWRTKRVEKDSVPVGLDKKELRVSEMIIPWYGITEMITQIDLCLNPVFNSHGYGNVHILDIQTEYKTQPERNLTVAKVAFEFI